MDFGIPGVTPKLAGGKGTDPSGDMVKLQLALLDEVFVWVSDSSASCEVREAVQSN